MIKDGMFHYKHGLFVMKCGSWMIKDGMFHYKHGLFVMKCGTLMIKHGAFHFKLTFKSHPKNSRKRN